MEMGSTRSYSVTKQSPHFDHLDSCEGGGVNGLEVARVARRRLRNGVFICYYGFETFKDRAQGAGDDNAGYRHI